MIHVLGPHDQAAIVISPSYGGIGAIIKCTMDVLRSYIAPDGMGCTATQALKPLTQGGGVTTLFQSNTGDAVFSKLGEVACFATFMGTSSKMAKAAAPFP